MLRIRPLSAMCFASRYRKARSHKAVNSGLKPFSLPAPKLLPQEFTTSCANSSERFKCSGRYGIFYPLLIHRGGTKIRCIYVGVGQVQDASNIRRQKDTEPPLQ